MFYRIQVRALAGPLKEFQRLVPKPLLCCLGCVLRVVVLLEGDLRPSLRSWMLWSRFSSRRDAWHSGQRVQSWFHPTRESCFSLSESPLGAFWQIPGWLSCAFYWGVASTRLVECCRDGCPSGRFSHLHRGTLELCQSGHRVLPDQGASPPLAQFGRAASSRKSLCGSKLLPFKNDGGHCVLGNFQCYRNVLVPFPRSEFYRQFLRAHDLVHCQLWDLFI